MPQGVHQILIYDYVENIVERRAPYREEHLAYAGRFKSEGKLVMGGAVGDPPGGAILVFAAEPSEVEEFAGQDPYVLAGLVTRWRVEPWNVVI